ncbi:VOC family protein [Paraburkholderia fynbosensis]|uniref:VOC family protein n=1 Tax=Paraburkholderia fynbosensis TaxID=1200993 RepID=UPI001FE4FDEC|nr:VOC family protein [Paraburkholderia fynbosensis]
MNAVLLSGKTCWNARRTAGSDKWTEFSLGEVRFGLLLNDFGDEFVGSGCVPVFEFDVFALHIFLDRAKAFGATVALDGLNNEAMKSIVLVSPDGHEFELCACHD